MEASSSTQGDGAAAIQSPITIESARASLHLLTGGLSPGSRRMVVLGILTVLHDHHTEGGGVAPLWLLALMADASPMSGR
jgi:hypothetical protein